MNKLTPKVDLYEKVTNLKSPPIIGQIYSVPHYKTDLDNIVTNSGYLGIYNPNKFYYVPIYLPVHEDGELLNFPYWHYHFDLRFFNKKMLGFWFYTIYKLNGIIDLNRINQKFSDEFKLIITKTNKPEFNNIYWKPIVCQRNTQKPQTNIFTLMEHFKNYKLSCLKCPHKGINLADIEPDGNGYVVCPAHGLKWNIKSGRNKEYYKYKESEHNWIKHIHKLLPQNIIDAIFVDRKYGRMLLLNYIYENVRPRPSLYPIWYKKINKHKKDIWEKMSNILSEYIFYEEQGRFIKT